MFTTTQCSQFFNFLFRKTWNVTFHVNFQNVLIYHITNLCLWQHKCCQIFYLFFRITWKVTFRINFQNVFMFHIVIEFNTKTQRLHSFKLTFRKTWNVTFHVNFQNVSTALWIIMALKYNLFKHIQVIFNYFIWCHICSTNFEFATSNVLSMPFLNLFRKTFYVTAFKWFQPKILVILQ